MSPFSQKNIPHNTIGDKLKRIREAAGLTVAEISDQLRIKKTYLIAIEDCNYKALPSETYIRIFIKSYAKFLDVDPQIALKMYTQESKPFAKRFDAQKKRTLLTAPRIRSVVLSKLAKTSVMFFIAVSVFSYIGWQISKTLTPPNLHIAEPSDNVVIQGHTLSIVGNTDPESKVTINGQLVSLGANGTFQEIVSLHDGLNTIEISSQKGSTRKSTVYKQIVVEPSS